MKNKLLTYAGFMAVMIALGSNDSLKGIFATIFQDHFRLSGMQLALIVTVSYAGNMLFLLAGGMMADRWGRKKTMLAAIVIWLASLLLFIVTDQYTALLIGMFFSMGASTLINMSINIVTPSMFAAMPAFAVNSLFFVQGIGTSGSQSLIGRFAGDIAAWKLTNLVLLAIGAAALLVLVWVKLPEGAGTGKADLAAAQPDAGGGRKDGETGGNKGNDAVAPGTGASVSGAGAAPAGFFRQPAPSFSSYWRSANFWFYVFIFGFYFVAEHGVMNWLVPYATSQLNMDMGKASTYLAVFYGGMTAGRLLLSPLVDRLGLMRSIRWFGAAAAALYIIGVLSGGGALILLSISGFLLSVIYPTLVMSIQSFWPNPGVSTVTGLIISVASLFDILFNLLFGRLIDTIGYQSSFLILPASMALFCGLFWLFAARVKRPHTRLSGKRVA